MRAARLVARGGTHLELLGCLCRQRAELSTVACFHQVCHALKTPQGYLVETLPHANEHANVKRAAGGGGVSAGGQRWKDLGSEELLAPLEASFEQRQKRVDVVGTVEVLGIRTDRRHQSREHGSFHGRGGLLPYELTEQLQTRPSTVTDTKHSGLG